MLTLGAYEKCKRYIESHTPEQQAKTKKIKTYPCVTISRQTGSGSYEVSDHLIKILQEKSNQPEVQWTYFNKELIKKVLEDHNLPGIVSGFLSEKKYEHVNDAVYELLGVKPSDWTLLHKTTDTILQIARMGNAILVGRGGAIIASKLPNVLHVRLVAPLESKIQHVKEVFNYKRDEAIKYIKKEDLRRKKYLKSHFFHDPDDLNLYHLILNTGMLGFKGTAEVIAGALMKKYPEYFN